MQAFIFPAPFHPGRAARHRSPVSLLFVVLWLFAAGTISLPAQTITSNFALGSTDANGVVSVRADWSTPFDGSDLFSTISGQAFDAHFHTPTYPTRYNLTIDATANLFAYSPGNTSGLGLINLAGPSTGAHSSVINYGTLNSYLFAYPSDIPTSFSYSDQNDCTVGLSYADLTNYGTIGNITGQIGFVGASGTGNYYVVAGSTSNITNYGTISGINDVYGVQVENYGNLFSEYGKGIYTISGTIQNHLGAHMISSYNASYGIDGNGNGGTPALIWNNWGVISWWLNAVQMVGGTIYFNDYGGPLLPGTLSYTTPTDGGYVWLLSGDTPLSPITRRSTQGATVKISTVLTSHTAEPSASAGRIATLSSSQMRRTSTTAQGQSSSQAPTKPPASTIRSTPSARPAP